MADGLGLPRVLLVEDDPSIARFVQLATADMALRLEVAPSVTAAQAALRTEPAALVITDLMLGGESGMVLLQALQADPQWRAGARLMVYSAGLSEPVLHRLRELDIWRVLGKPAPLAELRACIQEALAATPAAGDVPSGERGEALPAGPPQAETSAGRAEALRRFGGDVELFESYRASCLRQFGIDLGTGDQAAGHADLAAWRHLGHALRSVLRLIGEDPAAEAAAALEQACAAGDAAAAGRAWAGLRPWLAALAAQAPGGTRA